GRLTCFQAGKERSTTCCACSARPRPPKVAATADEMPTYIATAAVRLCASATRSVRAASRPRRSLPTRTHREHAPRHRQEVGAPPGEYECNGIATLGGNVAVKKGEPTTYRPTVLAIALAKAVIQRATIANVIVEAAREALGGGRPGSAAR